MAHLDRCYVSDMRLYRDRPDVLTRGRWYWSPPGAVPIPYYHVFGTQYQESDQHRIEPPVGEVPVRIKWTNGKANRRYTGKLWCGGQDVWTRGALYSQRGTPAVDADGIPPCCEPLPPDPGGVVVNGQSLFAWNPDEVMSGGVRLGGVVRTQPTTGIPVRGGVRLGGVVRTQPTTGIPVRGGVRLGGVVRTQPTTGIPVRGGVRLGGIVATHAGAGGTGRGGVLLGGIVVTHGPPGGHGAGGVLLGGIVPTGRTSGGVSAGGVLLGGVVPTTQQADEDGAGGVRLGGVVVTAGGGGIITACCPGTPMPLRGYLRLSGASNPLLNITVDVVYDPFWGFWLSAPFTYGICGTVMKFRCLPGDGWYFDGEGPFWAWSIPHASTDCGPPILATFDPAAMNNLFEINGCFAVGTGPALVEVSSVPF